MTILLELMSGLSLTNYNFKLIQNGIYADWVKAKAKYVSNCSLS